MYGFFITLHVFICIGLMISVLMQSAKGEGLAGAFGGSSLTGTVFGGRGAAPFLAKATSGLAVAFMTSCILLTFISPSRQVATTGGSTESAVEQAARERADEIPMQQPVAIPTDQFPAGDEAAQPTDQQAAPSAGETPPPTGEEQTDQPGGR